MTTKIALTLILDSDMAFIVIYFVCLAHLPLVRRVHIGEAVDHQRNPVRQAQRKFHQSCSVSSVIHG